MSIGKIEATSQHWMSKSTQVPWVSRLQRRGVARQCSRFNSRGKRKCTGKRQHKFPTIAKAPAGGHSCKAISESFAARDAGKAAVR